MTKLRFTPLPGNAWLHIIIRTHNHRATNKREPVFRGNHWQRPTLIPLLNNKGTFMSNTNQNNGNRNSAQQQDSKQQIDSAVATANSFAGSFQAIATAYGDYTKKSFDDTRSFVEKLSGVKSLDKAIEIQTEFAKSAFETFVAESQKIGALYGDLAKQSCKPFGGLAASMTPTNR
jgi:hypothetical protein